MKTKVIGGPMPVGAILPQSHELAQCGGAELPTESPSAGASLSSLDTTEKSFPWARHHRLDVTKVNAKRYESKYETNAVVATALANRGAYEVYAARAKTQKQEHMGPEWFQDGSGRVSECHHNFLAYHCPEDGFTFNPQPIHTCESRLCPFCAHTRSVKWLHRNLSRLYCYIGENKVDPCLATLTFFDGQLKGLSYHQAIKYCQKTFAAFRKKSEEWKRTVDSAVWSYEVTWSEKHQQFHPHIHALLLRRRGSFIDVKKMGEEWLQAGGGMSFNLKRIKSVEKGILEVIKYATKPSSIDGMPDDRILEVFDQVRGMHLVQMWGGLRGYKPTAEYQASKAAQVAEALKAMGQLDQALNFLPLPSESSELRRRCPCCGRRGQAISLTPSDFISRPIYQVADTWGFYDNKGRLPFSPS